MINEKKWVSVTETAQRLEVCYDKALALVQDRKLTSRLKNPEAKRKTYQVSVESIEKYERNTTLFAK